MPNLPRAVDARAGRPERLWPGNASRPPVRRMVYTNRPRAESPTPDQSCQGPVSAGLRRRELRDDLVAIAAVDRVHELECPATRVAPRALEEKGRRVKGYPELGRLVLVRHRGLDRLRSRGDLDAVPRVQQLVERALQVARPDTGNHAGRDVERLDRHRDPVGQ